MKTKTVNIRVLSFLLTLALGLPMFLALLAPASAASSRILSNVSTGACRGNLSSYALPASTGKAAVGQQLYVNVAATSDLRLKSIEAYASVNGGAYALIGKETANNYLRWASFGYRPSSAGTVAILVRVYYLNGKSASGTTTLTVTGAEAAPAASFNPVWPAPSANYISTLYYYWNGGNPRQHGTRSNNLNAIDIAGSGNVVAAESGTVVSAGWNSSGFGYAVTIRHANGLYSLYGHLSSISVRAGQSVSRGQAIGVIGSTGNSNGPHLHFELYNPSNYGQVVNPWVTYYQGRVSVVVGGNSRRANAAFPNNAASRAWVAYLDAHGTLNRSGDYQL